MSDEQLWRLCLEGDREAFKEIYCRFYSLLYNYGSRLSTDKELVKDCIQDIFIKMILNHKNLSVSPNLKGYLIKTLRNKLIDMMEKEKKIDNITLYHDQFITDDLSENFSFGDTEEEIRSKRLFKVFKEISPRQQEIIYLYYVKELKHEEIAEIMGINTQSSKNLLFRSLSKLRELYLKKT